MNIVLIGMRGSGKSTVGKQIAQLLGKKFRELDSEVEEKCGMKIKDMVDKQGWDFFRDKESEVVHEAAATDGCVISTGGGVVARDENIKALKRNGVCIYLKTPAELLIERIGGESSQLPRLTDSATMAEEMRNVLHKREPLYEKAADEVIDTSKLPIDDVVDEILRRVEKRHI